jgi:hypothetical protein
MGDSKFGDVSSGSDRRRSVADPTIEVKVPDEARSLLVHTKVTCPFLGPVVAMQRLPLRNEAANPLAGIEDLRKLGNSGGGDLGDLLVLFATGNHLAMRSEGGTLDARVPRGFFSLELPGSQGSHFGHSGILQGNPKALDSGRFSAPDFARLTGRARAGLIKRSDVGRFIAENLRRDPNSRVFGSSAAKLLLSDLGSFVASIGPAALGRLDGASDQVAETHRDFEQKLTKLLGNDNLVGSAGEFGLLFAFLANKPDAREEDGEPTISVSDLETMFVQKKLPSGWESWRKTRVDWVENTTALLISAGKEYLKLKGPVP